MCPAHSSHLLLSAQTSLALFKDYSDSLGGVYGSRLKPNEATTQMMAVKGCLSVGIPLHALGNPVFRDFLHHVGVKLPAAGNLSNYIPFVEEKEVSFVWCRYAPVYRTLPLALYHLGTLYIY